MKKFLNERQRNKSFQSPRAPAFSNAMKKYLTNRESDIASSRNALKAAIDTVGGKIVLWFHIFHFILWMNF